MQSTCATWQDCWFETKKLNDCVCTIRLAISEWQGTWKTRTTTFPVGGRFQLGGALQRFATHEYTCIDVWLFPATIIDVMIIMADVHD